MLGTQLMRLCSEFFYGSLACGGSHLTPTGSGDLTVTVNTDFMEGVELRGASITGFAPGSIYGSTFVLVQCFKLLSRRIRLNFLQVVSLSRATKPSRPKSVHALSQGTHK